MELMNELKSTVGKAVAAVGETWLRPTEERADGKCFVVGYTSQDDEEGKDEDRVLGAFDEMNDAVAFRKDVEALRLGHAALAAIKESGFEIKEVEKPVLVAGIAVDSPRFEDPERVNDWRSEVGPAVVAVWHTLATKQRLAIAQDADFHFRANNRGQE